MMMMMMTMMAMVMIMLMMLYKLMIRIGPPLWIFDEVSELSSLLRHNKTDYGTVVTSYSNFTSFLTLTKRCVTYYLQYRTYMGALKGDLPRLRSLK